MKNHFTFHCRTLLELRNLPLLSNQLVLSSCKTLPDTERQPERLSTLHGTPHVSRHPALSQEAVPESRSLSPWQKVALFKEACSCTLSLEGKCCLFFRRLGAWGAEKAASAKIVPINLRGGKQPLIAQEEEEGV